MTTPTTSTQVFYISVSVCCIVIFLVAIILAILHLHSMKRVEMEDRFVSLVSGHTHKFTCYIEANKKKEAEYRAVLQLCVCSVFVAFSAECCRSKTDKNRSSPQRGLYQAETCALAFLLFSFCNLHSRWL